ncbi:hypothetical protein [Endozoicomonas numazuensis]|uniref:Uncharacterized protein n=1 Tax=Endozoicomonas numazuensis TaxID=1137799 RepID=A0A081NGG1_9GAMM|nr:hypothetical protein [Endozoicomonas numazuensis]KEQ17534.1 hypothetical protein GZ78_17450 [Endozoicomonas numazuensis]
MKLIKMGAFLALCSAASFSQAERVGTQYFYGYQDQFPNGKWGIVDDLDYRQLKDNMPAREAKALYVDDNGRIQFDVQWTRQTLKRMYPQMWEEAMLLEGKARRERIQDIRDIACDAKLEIGYAKTYGINGDGFATEMDTDLNARNMEGCAKTVDGEAAAVRLRTFIPTVPGASYKLHVKYQKRGYNYAAKGLSEKKAYKDLLVKVGADRHSLNLEEELPVKLNHLTMDLLPIELDDSTLLFDGQILDEDGEAWVRYNNHTSHTESLYFESGSGERLTKVFTIAGETSTYINLGKLDESDAVYAVRNDLDQTLIDFNVDALRQANRFDAPYTVKLEEGFKKSVIPFVADKFFTRVAFNDKSYADTFGVLIRGVHVDRVEANPLEEGCRAVFPANSNKLRKCLLGDSSDPVAEACDLSSGKVFWTQGENTRNDSYRSDIASLFYGADHREFLSLGQGGRVMIKPALAGKAASCPIQHQTLSFKEVTWGNQTYETYAEKGLVKVKLKGCQDSSLNGSKLLSNDVSMRSSLQTNDGFSFYFGEDYEGCRMHSLSIIDRTQKIKSSQAGYVANSDGIDINSLSLGSN